MLSIPTKTFYLEVAKPNDVQAIVDYYQSPERPATVFARTHDSVAETVNNDLFFLLRDQDNRILAASAVYVLDCELESGAASPIVPHAAPDPVMTSVRVAEFGSLWRNDITNAPRGGIRELMYSAATLQLFDKALDLDVSLYVTQVVASAEKTISQLTNMGMGWRGYTPAPSFRSRFCGTISDAGSRETPLSTFITRVDPAVKKAAALLNGLESSRFIPSAKSKILTALDPSGSPAYNVDLRETNIPELACKVGKIKEAIIPEKIEWWRASGFFLHSGERRAIRIDRPQPPPPIVAAIA